MRKFLPKRSAPRCLILTTAGLIGLACGPALADTLYWDPEFTGSTSGGGSGTWDQSTQEWFDQDLDSEVYWDNAGWTNGPDNAVFGNSPGAITLAGPIVAATLTFNSDGYVLNGGSLSLTSGSATTFSTSGGPGTESINTTAGTANITVGSGMTATINSPFNGGSNVLTLDGGGTLVLGAQSSYSGTTSILSGTLQIGATNALPTSTNVYLGTNQGPGVTLNLNGFNQTINNLIAISGATSGGATDTIVIGAGNTLNITDSGGAPMFFGAGSTSVVSGLATNVYFVGPSGRGNGGGGNLTINASYSNGNPSYGTNLGIGFFVGNRSDSATVDMRDLASFTASLGTMEIGDYNTAQTGTDTCTLYLAPISNITVSTLRIGADSAGAAGSAITESLYLGNTDNQINAVDIRVGVDNGGSTPPTGTTNARVNGMLEFNGGSDSNPSAGSVEINGLNGPGSFASMWMINAAPATSNSLVSTVDLGGHHAVVNLQQLIMALRTYGSTSGSNATATFTFAPPAGDTGSQLQIVGNAILGDRGSYSSTGTSSGTGNVSATLNIGGPASTSINIGAVTMAINNSVSTRTGTSTGIINFSGGTGSIASLSMANNTLTNASDTSNGTLNITGGSLSLGGDITRAGGGGIENTTLILNGGLLDMTGHNIGGANAIGSGTGSLSFQAGTLQNVLEINAGATALVKTGTGTLILTGSMGNAYSGGTSVTAGTLLANSTNTTNGSTGSGPVNIFSGGVLAGMGDILGANAQITVNIGSAGIGGIISAGNGASSTNTTGLLTTTGGNGSSVYSQLWDGGSNGTGGAYAWKVNAGSSTSSTVSQSNGVGTTDPSGAGTNWDMLSMASLDIAASSGSQFNIQVVPTGSSAASFNASSSYTWTIADVTSGTITVNGTKYSGNYASTLASLQGALQAALALNTSALPAPSSNFSIVAAPDNASGDVVEISYAPAPEPSAFVLLGLGAGALMTRRRRMR